ncbi:Outer membrane protein slp [bacterium HR30]|nr:Outer membrane protein slp [bacterium HR30]
MKKVFWWVGFSLALSGCASRLPPELAAAELAEVKLSEAQGGDGVGRYVRWGGTIARIHVENEATCLELVKRRLDSSGRPILEDASEGRFLACQPELLDPEVYRKGRSVTVVGKMALVREGMIGQRPYRFPVIEADQVYLWPEARQARRPCTCSISPYPGPALWAPPSWGPLWYRGWIVP